MTVGTHQAIHDPRNESVLISINGELFARNEAKISVFDSGYLVGDGIWEALRLHSGRLVFAEDHWQRLKNASFATGIEVDIPSVEAQVIRVLQANKMQSDVHVRIMITRGMKQTPSQDPRLTVSGPNMVIIPEYKIAAEESKKGIKLFTSTIRRGGPDYLDPKLNCHSKLHEVIALNQAIAAGADEALMLDVNGFVATCNSTNFFIVKGNEVWTSTDKYCMNGITRQKIVSICNQQQIVCREKDFSLFDVYGADEAFVTGTFGGLTPVTMIDGKEIGKPLHYPTITKLQELYLDLIQQSINL